MRKAFKFALAAALVTIIVPALAYRLMTPADEDPMAETLRDFGFVRVRLPSNLMNVGSLYYVDSGLKDFKTTCHARAAEFGEDVIASRSWDIEKTLQRKGRVGYRRVDRFRLGSQRAPTTMIIPTPCISH